MFIHRHWTPTSGRKLLPMGKGVAQVSGIGAVHNSRSSELIRLELPQKLNMSAEGLRLMGSDTHHRGTFYLGHLLAVGEK